jgi:hypothetical protein
MRRGSALTSTFRTERPRPDTVTLVVTTVPNRQGDLGLFAVLAAGLCLTAVLGSYNDDIRAAAMPVLIAVLGMGVLGGLALKFFVAWAARKTSGTVSWCSSTRSLSQQGLQALFPWSERGIPVEAVIVLDAVSVLRPTASSRHDPVHTSVHVRLWCVPADGRTPEQLGQCVEALRDTLRRETFQSLASAPLPAGAIPIGTALENPVFRRLAKMLAEHGGCTAYDATGAQVERIEAQSALRSVAIPAPRTHVIPTTSLPVRILFTLMAIVVAGVVALFSLNPYLFVYLVLLVITAVSARQVLVCDAAGLHLHYSYLLGLWRRGHDDRRWDEITAIQIENVSGFIALAIRRADGNDWKIIVPSERIGRRLEEQFKDFIRA